MTVFTRSLHIQSLVLLTSSASAINVSATKWESQGESIFHHNPHIPPCLFPSTDVSCVVHLADAYLGSWEWLIHIPSFLLPQG